VQYAGSVLSNHSQRQALVEPLSLQAYQQVPLQGSQQKGGGLGIHTSGFNCKLKARLWSRNSNFRLQLAKFFGSDSGSNI